MSDRTTEPTVASASIADRPALLVTLLQALGLGGLFAVLLVVFGVAVPGFFSESSAVNIVSNSSVLALVTAGQVLVIIAGGFDLSVAGIVPMCSVLYVALSNAGVATVPCLILTLMAGGAVGVGNAALIAKAGLNPIITTLATFTIAAALAQVISGGETLTLENLGAGVLADDLPGTSVGIFVAVAVVIALLIGLVARATVFGRSVYAVGGNPEASRLAGIRVGRTVSATYVLSGALSALAGVVLASQLLAGSPTVAADIGFDSATAAVLGGAGVGGGTGSVAGAMLAVLVLGTLSHGLALLHVQAFYAQIITGVILLMAIGLARARQALQTR